MDFFSIFSPLQGKKSIKRTKFAKEIKTKKMALVGFLKKILKKWSHTSLIVRILCGLIIGALLGLFCPSASVVSLLGVVFVGALKSIAPILVAVLVVSALSKANEGIGGRFRTVIKLYLLGTCVAALVAVGSSDLFRVEMVLSGQSEATSPGGLYEVFQNMLLNIVNNPVGSLSSGNYIGILFWAIVIGIGLRKLASPTTITIISDFAEVLSMAVKWIIQFAPFGILGLVFSSVSESGLGVFTTYGQLVLLLVGCMLFVALIVNPLIVYLYLRKNPYPLVWTCLKESGLPAFFTRSSAANIPINMELCKRMGIDEKFYSVSIPLGSTINMEGAAITITVMTLAVCHTQGVSVSIPSALLLSLLSTLAACGASGVAGGSLLLIPMACSLFGISHDISMQAVAVGFIIGVIQDSMETALNSSSDALFTITAEQYDKRRESKVSNQ